MARRNTKELILQESLKLFSQSGFDGVGVREIAATVGIRESAIYKHYRGKQDILNSIIKLIHKQFEEATASYKAPPELEAVFVGHESMDELLKMFACMFHFYLKDEYGASLRRLLTLERYKNSVASDVFREQLFEIGMGYSEAVFADFVGKGYCSGDPAVMALQFYAPLFLLLVMYDERPDQYEEALAKLIAHYTQFKAFYQIGA